ncbi:MAG: hypothetical protein SFY66_19570 [Oculatellaceae cyanobacterium bins.114]|nr:hypothetical protein [Oculatellaceae cyanobacterium bins.114]
MLDIDWGSYYHPRRDRFAISRIIEALETIGITSFVPVTSSYSNGIHLYFPLSNGQSSWELALVVRHLLECKGLKVADGLLETFPNVCNYDIEKQSFAKYKAHRLPLQAGSYLLTDNWALSWDSPAEFVKQWQFCQARNVVDEEEFERLRKIANTNYRRIGYKGEKFLSDLDTEIEPGWTDFGQTNHLLGRITLREYIFRHRIDGGEPLTGDRLVAQIVKVAASLPGYNRYCRHKTEIWSRATDWARCVENSKYYPYGQTPTRKAEQKKVKPTWTKWNDFLKARAIERICFAIADLLNQERFPAGITDRFNILTAEYGFSGETLYHHLDLWHPEYIGRPAEVEPVDNPPAPPQCLSESLLVAGVGAPRPNAAKSLLPSDGRKPALDVVQEWFKGWDLDGSGCNSPSGGGFSDLSQILEAWKRSPQSADYGGGGIYGNHHQGKAPDRHLCEPPMPAD